MCTIDRLQSLLRSTLLFQFASFCNLAATCALLLMLLGCGIAGSGVAISTSSFDFGDVALSTQVRRMVVTVTNSTNSTITLSPSLSGSADFALASGVSCGSTLAAAASCSGVVLFAPSRTGTQETILDMGMSSADQRIAIKGTGVQLASGQGIVSGTGNPLVALYTYAPEVSGNVSIEFGLDTNYRQKTLAQTAQAGTPVSILVAGMRANSIYHMRATVAESSSGTSADSDHTFVTANFPADTLPALTVTTNGTPQPGIELMNPAEGLNHTYLQAYAVDLQGNLIWGYDYPDRQSDTQIQSYKQLPNGDMLVVLSDNSGVSALREINLAGVPVRQITLDQLNTALARAGYSITLADLHHDVIVTPNGHWLVLSNAIKSYTGLPGTSGITNVLGDLVVDLDPNLNPVWVWSEFDHLDINRAPAGYPDWTHSNAILYSPSDGNLLVSSRSQSWIMKIDYRNGAGTGNLLWRLGYQGDFTLVNGTEPRDWFYGQHQPSFVGATSSGAFSITMMDDGFTRQLSPGDVCSGSSCYSTVPILSVDEGAMTATITWRDAFPSAMYSVWGGGTTALANGDLEFDLCAEPNTTSEVDEVTVTSTPTTVWSLKTTAQNLYRANRMPSLYPGVQW